MARSEFLPLEVEVPGQGSAAPVPGADGTIRKPAGDPRRTVIVALAVALVVTILVTYLFDESFLGTANAYRLGMGFVAQTVSDHFVALLKLATGQNAGYCVFLLIAAIIAALAGGALGASGAVYQGTMRNALASPSTLGIISGGQIGMCLYILATYTDDYQSMAMSVDEMAEYLAALNPWEYLWAVEGRAFCAIIGCFLAAALVLAVGRLAGHGRRSKVALIITGQIIATSASSIVMVITYYLQNAGGGNQAQAISAMNQGNIPFTPLDLALVGIPVVSGLIVLLTLSKRMNLLAFGDEEARSMGISTYRLQVASAIICTLLTAVVVSFCGVIGFVGFIAPHIARRIVGPDMRFLLPASMLIGALYVVLGMFIVNLGAFDGALRLGLLTNVLGAIAFVVTALRGRSKGNVDWL